MESFDQQHGRRERILAVVFFGGEQMAIWAVIVGICVITLIAEACYIIPDKMPWNRRTKK